MLTAEGWALGLLVKTPVGTPASHIEAVSSRPHPPAKCTLRGTRDGSRGLVPAIHGGDGGAGTWNESPAPGVGSGLALAIAAIWGLNQQMGVL